jgi:hypothetical protein
VKNHEFLRPAFLSIIALGLLVPSIAAQQSSLPGVPAKMVVTVEARHGSTVPDIYSEDVMVMKVTIATRSRAGSHSREIMRGSNCSYCSTTV